MNNNKNSKIKMLIAIVLAVIVTSICWSYILFIVEIDRHTGSTSIQTIIILTNETDQELEYTIERLYPENEEPDSINDIMVIVNLRTDYFDFDLNESYVQWENFSIAFVDSNNNQMFDKGDKFVIEVGDYDKLDALVISTTRNMICGTFSWKKPAAP